MDSNPGTYCQRPGGVGRNIAENLARLGARVELVSVLGDDGDSASLAASCASVGIGLEGSLRLENCPASRYLCLLDSDGSLAGAVAAMDSIDLLTPERLAERAGFLDSADLILVDANIPEASIRWLAARYPKGDGGPLLGFDPVSAAKAPRGAASLGSFAFAKPNRVEASLLAGLGPREPGLVPEALARLLLGKGLGEAFISLGSDGLFAMASETWIARLPPSPPRGLEAVNASGAGDAACAAIAWGLLRGIPLGERCALALAAAMLAAASQSPVNPDMDADLLMETAKGIPRERVS